MMRHYKDDCVCHKCAKYMPGLPTNCQIEEKWHQECVQADPKLSEMVYWSILVCPEYKEIEDEQLDG